LDFQARRTGGESQTISYSEDEEDLVSAEELKHEMSAEKGLAWFDLGNGKIVKGRSFWFNASIPDTWEGREFIVHPERFEMDEIGLADWVDERILSQEQDETSAKFATKPRPDAPQTGDRKPNEGSAKSNSSGPSGANSAAGAESVPGSFKLNMMPRSGARPRGSVTAITRPPTQTAPTEAPPDEPEQKNPPKPPTEKSEPKAATTKQDAASKPPGKGPKTGPLRLRK
jgi:hypothetical protein